MSRPPIISGRLGGLPGHSHTPGNASAEPTWPGREIYAAILQGASGCVELILSLHIIDHPAYTKFCRRFLFLPSRSHAT